MIIFHTDLDNTIIYSYKHDLGPDKINVEIYKEKEITFISRRTKELLQEVSEKVLLVPTTTRTVEQYERIHLGIDEPEYALTCNGGVLLIKGERDSAWYEESVRMIADCRTELEKGMEILEKDPARSLDVRFIEKLFLFTKSEDPEKTLEMLSRELDTGKVDLYAQGAKVYVVPKQLNKGTAVKRFRSYLTRNNKDYISDVHIIAAGDSGFDIPMLMAADIGLAPKGLAEEAELSESITVMPGEKLFAEEVLEYIGRKV